MSTLLQSLIGGVSIGLVYGLFGVGYCLMFSVMRCINIAHAGTFVLCALACCSLSTRLDNSGWVIVPLVLATMLLGVICNLAIHVVSLQPLFRRSLIKTNIEMASFLATLGAFFVTQTIAIQATDGQAVSMNVNLVSLGTITLLGEQFPLKYLVVGITALISLAVLLRLLYSPLGRRLRATAENRLLANVLGIDIQSSQRIAMSIAGAMAGLGGAMIAYLYGQASFGLAESFLVKSIIIGIVAGMGSLVGALAVSVGLGIVETTTINLLGSGWRDIASFVIVIAVLAIRPQGLFARRKRLAT